jgi:hypothetical protein
MRERTLLLILVLSGLWCVDIVPVALSALGRERRDLVEIQFPKTVPFPLPSSWRGIIPLRTTRSEAERILGQPKIHIGQHYVYENETERVDVTYSSGRGEPEARWNVTPNVVTTIDVSPSKTLLLEDLTFDKRKYVRQKWSHPQEWVTYRNKEEGIWIETTSLNDKTEEVRSIKYLPKATDKELKCKE